MVLKIGPGALGAATIIFLILKLCGVIAWSWWWVFSPIWMPFALFFGFMLVTLLLAVTLAWIDTR